MQESLGLVFGALAFVLQVLPWWPALCGLPLIHVDIANSASPHVKPHISYLLPRGFPADAHTSGDLLGIMYGQPRRSVWKLTPLGANLWPMGVGRQSVPCPLDRLSWIGIAQRASWKTVLWDFEKSVVLTWYQGDLEYLLFLHLFFSFHFFFLGIILLSQIVAHKQPSGSVFRETQAQTIGDLQLLLEYF